MSTIGVKFNRPNRVYFKDGPVIGVTL